MKWLAWLALCVMAVGAHVVRAQALSTSYSLWILSGNMVTMRYMLPVAEAQRLSGTSVALVTIRTLEDYILAHVAVTASGRDCPVADQPYDLGQVDPLAVGPGLYGFEIFFQCDDPTGMVLHDHVLFDRLPGHVNFARIQTGSRFAEELFTARHQQLSVPDGGIMPDAGIGSYIRLGYAHVSRSLDRWCFLLGLLLLMRRRSDLGYAIAGLAGGYALSMAVSLGHWMVPRQAMLEAFVGFMVALAAAQLIARERAQPRVVAAVSAALLLLLAAGTAIARQPWPALVLGGAGLVAGGGIVIFTRLATRPIVWLLPAAVLGFLDGFALPSALTLMPLHLPEHAEVLMLAGFNTGALLTGGTLLLVLAGAFVLLRRKNLMLPRTVLNDIAAACLGGLGVFWLLSRLYS